jgi:hypothetical protein
MCAFVQTSLSLRLILNPSHQDQLHPKDSSWQAKDPPRIYSIHTSGDKIKTWGKVGAFWGGIWGLLIAPAMFFIPGVRAADPRRRSRYSEGKGGTQSSRSDGVALTRQIKRLFCQEVIGRIPF